MSARTILNPTANNVLNINYLPTWAGTIADVVAVASGATVQYAFVLPVSYSSQPSSIVLTPIANGTVQWGFETAGPIAVDQLTVFFTNLGDAEITVSGIKLVIFGGQIEGKPAPIPAP
jgi:hypothetical protein